MPNRPLPLHARRLARRAAPLLLVLLAACNSGTTANDSGAAPQLRVADLASTAPTNFDVLQGSTTVATDLAYGATTAFQAQSAGGLSVKFEPTGTTTVSFTDAITAASGTDYTVLAVEGTAGLTYLTVAQNIVTLGTNAVQLNFVNATPGTGSLDFYVTAPTATLPSTPSQSAIVYPGDAGSVTPVPLAETAGEYRIQAVKTGDTSQTVIYDSGPIALAAGDNPLFVVVPVTGSASAFALVRLDPGSAVTTTLADQRVQLRVGNFAPASVGVDTYFDQGGTGNVTPFYAGLALNAASAYRELLPGAYHASFTNTGSTTELVGSDLALAAGTSVSVFETGLSGLASPYDLKLVALRDDLRAPASGLAKLRVVYLAPDVGASVDLVSLSGTGVISSTLIGNLAYAGASTYATVAPGTYTLAIVPTGATTPLLPTSTGVALALAANTIYTLVVAGCENPGTTNCPGATTPLQFVQLTD